MSFLYLWSFCFCFWSGGRGQFMLQVILIQIIIKLAFGNYWPLYLLWKSWPWFCFWGKQTLSGGQQRGYLHPGPRTGNSSSLWNWKGSWNWKPLSMGPAAAKCYYTSRESKLPNGEVCGLLGRSQSWPGWLPGFLGDHLWQMLLFPGAHSPSFFQQKLDFVGGSHVLTALYIYQLPLKKGVATGLSSSK